MTTIYTFAQSAIEEARSAGRYGTANLYSGAINSFRNFTGDIPLTFKEVTAGMIKRYEESCYRKAGATTPSPPICACCVPYSTRHTSKAFPIRYLPTSCSASFHRYEPTAKRAISPALIRRLSQLNLEHSPNLRFSRDLFLLSFYLRGIPFVDLVHLRKTDMKHNTIYYYRRKTRQQLSVYLEPYAAEILRRYADKHSPSPYLLPILSSVGPEGYRQYKSACVLQPAPAPAIQDAAPECAAHLLRGTPQLGHHRQRRRSSHCHDKRRPGTQFRKGDTRIPRIF